MCSYSNCSLCGVVVLEIKITNLENTSNWGGKVSKKRVLIIYHKETIDYEVMYYEHETNKIIIKNLTK